MLPTIEHSGRTFTAKSQSWIPGCTVVYWPIEEFFARYPAFCNHAKKLYKFMYEKNGAAEGTIQRNCPCGMCDKAWKNPHNN